MKLSVSSVHRPHLSGGSDLLLPVLLHMKLGGATHTAHAGHTGEAGFSHIVSLLPGWQDLSRGRYLQEDSTMMSYTSVTPGSAAIHES